MSDWSPHDRRIPADPAGDHDHWMTRLTTLDEHDVEVLLAGHTPEGMHDLAPIADVTSTLRARAATEVAPAMGTALRRALAEAPAATPGHQPGRTRRPLAALTAAAVGLVAFGVASAANALPAPLQRMVAEAGDLVGVAVPRPDDDDQVVDTEGPDDRPGGTSSGDAEGNDERPGGDGVEDTGGDNTGPPASTPGGATPADPGEPGDKEPATPAIPPEHSEGGNENGTGPGSGNGQGQDNGQGQANGQGEGSGEGRSSAPGQGNPNTHPNPNANSAAGGKPTG